MMRRLSLSGIATTVIAFAAFILTPAAHADPITFTFTGVGDGVFAGSEFTNAPFTLTVLGDTNDINFDFGADTPSLNALSATLDLSGFGTFDVTDPLYVFNNQTFQFAGWGVVGAGVDSWDQTDPTLALFGLNTDFGPISQTDPELFFVSEVGTSGGVWNMTPTSGQPGTFQSVVGGAAAAPEPGSLAFLALAAVPIAGVARRRSMR